MWQNGILFLFFLPVVCAMMSDSTGCSTDPLPAVAVAAATTAAAVAVKRKRAPQERVPCEKCGKVIARCAMASHLKKHADPDKAKRRMQEKIPMLMLFTSV